MKRSRKQRPDFFDQQPSFDIFAEFEKQRSDELKSIENHSNLPRRSFLKITLGLVALTLCFGSLYYWLTPESDLYERNVHIRAVSQDGRPIPAAQVFFGTERLGRTDSYGEWQHRLQFEAGQNLVFRVLKKRGQHTLLKGAGRLHFDPNDKHTFDTVRFNIELRNSTKSSLSTAKVKEMPSVALSSSRRQSPTSLVVEADETGSNLTPISSPAVRDNAHLNKISVRFVTSPNRYGTIMEAHQSRLLKERVIPELKTRLQSDGLELSASSTFQYTLSYVPVKNNVGFIKGEIEWIDGDGVRQKRRYLKNFAKTITDTAEVLSYNLKTHTRRDYQFAKEDKNWILATLGMARFWMIDPRVTLQNTAGQSFKVKQDQAGSIVLKGNPCASYREVCVLTSSDPLETAPEPGWKKGFVDLTGIVPADAELYVSGYAAKKVTADKNRYSYWGHDKHKLYFTVVSKNRIVKRQRIAFDRRKPVKLALTSTVASKSTKK